jgi:hypothetical protein
MQKKAKRQLCDLMAIENYLLGVGCFGAQIRHYEGLSQVLIKSCMLR